MEKSNQRLLSLDVLRGATVAAMILVNNDLIFPFFLFIVGVSITYAMSSKKANPQAHTKTILKAAPFRGYYQET
jgi:predicted acyltransferase